MELATTHQCRKVPVPHRKAQVEMTSKVLNCVPLCRDCHTGSFLEVTDSPKFAMMSSSMAPRLMRRSQLQMAREESIPDREIN